MVVVVVNNGLLMLVTLLSLLPFQFLSQLQYHLFPFYSLCHHHYHCYHYVLLLLLLLLLTAGDVRLSEPNEADPISGHSQSDQKDKIW